MEFPRQEYWSGLPFPSLGDHLDPEIESVSPHASPARQGASWEALAFPFRSAHPHLFFSPIFASVS